MATVTSEAVSCNGFSSDTFDRYVLGLLSGEERARVDEQIERQCPLCIKGVQRSMNLWLVFANSLEQKEPAADFRGRLVRIAELSNRVLTIPKRHKRIQEPAILISSLVMICLVVLTLMIFTWIAGQQSAGMDRERRNHELQQLTGELTDKEVQLKRRDELVHELESNRNSSEPSTLQQQKQLQDSLSKAQAAVQQYKDIFVRQGKETTENTALVIAFSNPGVRLMPFKHSEGASAVAYALVMESSRIVFIGSNFRMLPERRQYQLWLARKDEAPLISAGLFTPKKGEPVFLDYSENKESIANLSGLLVTEEPMNGSSKPSGPWVMETPNLAQ